MVPKGALSMPPQQDCTRVTGMNGSISGATPPQAEMISQLQTGMLSSSMLTPRHGNYFADNLTQPCGYGGLLAYTASFT